MEVNEAMRVECSLRNKANVAQWKKEEIIKIQDLVLKYIGFFFSADFR